MMPEPSAFSLRSFGMLKCPSPAPKNCRKKGSIGICSADSSREGTIFEEEIFTTDGNTVLTTGAKLVLLGPSLTSASLRVAGGFLASEFAVVWAMEIPAAPKTKPTASASNLEPGDEINRFMCPSFCAYWQPAEPSRSGCAFFCHIPSDA